MREAAHDQVADDKLIWLVVLQLTFVVTTLVLALTERFGKH